mgnify:CR=1 FL=1
MEKKHTQKESLYWIGEVGQPNDGGPGTDFYALKNNFVSILWCYAPHHRY